MLIDIFNHCTISTDIVQYYQLFSNMTDIDRYCLGLFGILLNKFQYYQCFQISYVALFHHTLLDCQILSTCKLNTKTGISKNENVKLL